MTGSHSITLHDRLHDKCGKVVHRPCSSCISNIGKSNKDSIEFSLSIAEQRAVGFIPAWSLAFLQAVKNRCWTLLEVEIVLEGDKRT